MKIQETKKQLVELLKPLDIEVTLASDIDKNGMLRIVLTPFKLPNRALRQAWNSSGLAGNVVMCLRKSNLEPKYIGGALDVNVVFDVNVSNFLPVTIQILKPMTNTELLKLSKSTRQLLELFEIELKDGQTKEYRIRLAKKLGKVNRLVHSLLEQVETE